MQIIGYQLVCQIIKHLEDLKLKWHTSINKKNLND